MPPRKRLTKVQQARHLLTHGGVAREDSDDELGLEDLPWKWIYETNGYESEEDGTSEHGTPEDAPRGRKRKRKTQPKDKAEIIGAKMGTFECRIGDCVMLKAEGNKEAWVGLICDFSEDDDEKVCELHVVLV